MPKSISLPEILDAHNAAQNENTHTCLPCKVVSYDATTQTVAAQPLVKRPGKDEDGETVYEQLPVYPSVPVAFPRAAGFVVYLPIVAGSFGHLIFCDMATGEAVSSGQVSEPKDISRHNGGYCIFLPAQAVAPQVLSDHPANGYIGLDNNEAQIHFTSGEIKVGKTATDFVALAAKVLTELQNIATTFNSHTHPVGGSAPPFSGTPATVSGPIIITASSVAAANVKAK